MQSLGVRHHDSKRNMNPASANVRGGFSRLQQRPIWRAAGWLADIPRGTGSALSVAFLGLTIAYGVALGGQGRMVSEALTSAVGFSIKAVKLTGQRETDEFQILEALEIESGSSLPLFDARAAKRRLGRIAWIETVSVQKLYPGTLHVVIEEKTPYALWQRGQVVSIVDRDGNIITDEIETRHARLPLLVGHGAQRKAKDILDHLASFPGLKAQVRASKFVSSRRWNLVLQNGVVIRLPEKNILAALTELEVLDRENGLLSRDITAIDMRLADRIVVRLTDGAVERRDTTLKAAGGSKRKEADT